MREWLKRLLCVMLVICTVLPCAAMAEEDDDELLIEEIMLDDEEPEEVAEPASDEEYEAFWEDEYALTETESRQLEAMDADIDTSVDPANLNLNPNLPDNVVNILLMGIDTRDTKLDSGYQHNDVNMVVSVNLDTGEIKMTSLLRDLYVTLPGHRNKNRLNLAYQWGGGQLAMSTINKNFDLNIQYYVTINFYGLASIIDAMGGIDVDLSRAEATHINWYLKKNPPAYDNNKGVKRTPLEKRAGVQHLDGVQAVMYARTRKAEKNDNDFRRTARQRHLMELLLNKVVSEMDTGDLINLIGTCVEFVHTNMNTEIMFRLALSVIGGGAMDKLAAGGSLMEQHRIPMDGTYGYKTVNGNSVVAMGTRNLQKNIEALHQFIYGAYIPAK